MIGFQVHYGGETGWGFPPSRLIECHTDRVKKLAVLPGDPHTLLSVTSHPFLFILLVGGSFGVGLSACLSLRFLIYYCQQALTNTNLVFKTV